MIQYYSVAKFELLSFRNSVILSYDIFEIRNIHYFDIFIRLLLITNTFYPMIFIVCRLIIELVISIPIGLLGIGIGCFEYILFMRTKYLQQFIRNPFLLNACSIVLLIIFIFYKGFF